jgi:ketosteroid isomerase-like protein
MHANAAIIERLYAALDAGDGETMASLYAPDAVFRDPAFGELHGAEVGDMWRMLCAQATDLSVSVSHVGAQDSMGSAVWVARYTFTATGRPVENHVAAAFWFRDGRITVHTDSFSMWRWSRQALGPAAFVLGSNPFGQALVRRRANAGRASRYSIPSRSSRPSSLRHPRRTRIDRSRCTRRPSSASISSRADVPIARTI